MRPTPGPDTHVKEKPHPINKRNLVQHVAESAGIDQTTAEKALDAVLGGVSETLTKGEKVSLAGFGTFEVRERSARTGRNPQTGASIEIAASKAPAFKPASALKDAVNG